MREPASLDDQFARIIAKLDRLILMVALTLALTVVVFVELFAA
jgi:hypothetical protein